MKSFLTFCLTMLALGVYAQGPYAPAAGVKGTTAIHKDSSAFISWASEVSITRGKQDIANKGSDTTSIGVAANAIGKADGTNIVSLGDSGIAILSFPGKIYNGDGPDFAVFENAFNTSFLELAFVEVSSNGVDFYRFPAHSLTDTSKPVGSFGALDPTQLYNLAGKYQANYGTPFDLEELNDIPGLDIENITHLKIIDVVGTLNEQHATRDSEGRKVNDQYPTPFPSGGFDLDAVGVIHLKTVGLGEVINQSTINLFPNPANSFFIIDEKWKTGTLNIYDQQGQLLKREMISSTEVDINSLKSGLYHITIQKETQVVHTKLIKH